jgi:hypothetical protein
MTGRKNHNHKTAKKHDRKRHPSRGTRIHWYVTLADLDKELHKPSIGEMNDVGTVEETQLFKTQ